MQSTLSIGDFIVSDVWAYRNQKPEVGDIVIFKYSVYEASAYVKRVIGTPGDLVEIKAGQVYVNGIKLNEPYVERQNNSQTAKRDFSVKVPPEQYFLMGDNRDNSADSRMRGSILVSNIKAKFRLVWLNISR